MREILFRGKRIDDGEWVKGFPVISNERTFIGVFPECVTSSNCPNDIYTFTSFVEVIPESVGQWAGLNDNTKWEELTPEEQALFLYSTQGGKQAKCDWVGKKIFDGDIIKGYCETSSKRWKVCWVVEYFNGAFGLVSADRKDFLPLINKSLVVRALKVIGNIHDNPELLEGGKL